MILLAKEKKLRTEKRNAVYEPWYLTIGAFQLSDDSIKDKTLFMRYDDGKNSIHLLKDASPITGIVRILGSVGLDFRTDQ